eukprot:tig00000219_g19498.t1
MAAASPQSLHAQALALAKSGADAAELGLLQAAVDSFAEAIELFMRETDLLKRAGRAEEAERARRLAAGCLQTAENLKAQMQAPALPYASSYPSAQPASHHSALSGSGFYASAPPLPPSAPAMPPPPSTPPPPPAATPDEARRRMLQGVVQLRCGRSSGSGSVISSRGHILTNAHVIEGDGPIFVACNMDLKSEPIVRYIAKPLQVDKDLDLALLHVVANYHDQQARSFDIDLEPVPLGDSRDLSIGDTLWIVGFPGLGGGTVTLTQGIVSGFLDEGQWIKTDAEINPGNSGGGAFRDGRLVAVASAAASERSTSQEGAKVLGKLGLLRPLHLARPLVTRAREVGGTGGAPCAPIPG